jgi:hypothetical protein
MAPTTSVAATPAAREPLALAVIYEEEEEEIGNVFSGASIFSHARFYV